MTLTEQLYPVLVRRHEFNQDGGGAGQWRGGTGVIYEADVQTAGEYSFRGEGLFDPSGFGFAGGLPGVAGELSVRMPDGSVFEPAQYSLNQLPPVRLHLVSRGGGGLGDPHRRAVEAVRLDVRDGVVSLEAARAQYGVAFSADGASVDMAATAQLRSTP